MERAGTGGALFRNLYRDFLKESAEHLESNELFEVHKAFVDIASKWTEIANLFHEAGASGDIKHLNAASDLFVDLSESEKSNMEKLQLVCK